MNEQRTTRLPVSEAVLAQWRRPNGGFPVFYVESWRGAEICPDCACTAAHDPDAHPGAKPDGNGRPVAPGVRIFCARCGDHIVESTEEEWEAL